MTSLLAALASLPRIASALESLATAFTENKPPDVLPRDTAIININGTIDFTPNQMLPLSQEILTHHRAILVGNDYLGRRAGHIRKLV